MQLGSETDAARRHFAGSVEEVDSGRELRFRSTEELLGFLAECFDDATPPERARDGPLLE